MTIYRALAHYLYGGGNCPPDCHPGRWRAICKFFKTHGTDHLVG